VFEGERLTDLRPDPGNRARQLIEDFMIAANSITAAFLAARGMPVLRRVLPTPRRWDRIVALASALGDVLPDTRVPRRSASSWCGAGSLTLSAFPT